MNGIAAFGHELVVVLDELEAVAEARCLAFGRPRPRPVAGERPTRARRAERPGAAHCPPACPGALVELRAGDLAFTAREVRAFLGTGPILRLGDAELEMLRERTEGWPAALELAVLWLRGSGGSRAHSRASSGRPFRLRRRVPEQRGAGQGARRRRSLRSCCTHRCSAGSKPEALRRRARPVGLGRDVVAARAIEPVRRPARARRPGTRASAVAGVRASSRRGGRPGRRFCDPPPPPPEFMSQGFQRTLRATRRRPATSISSRDCSSSIT